MLSREERILSELLLSRGLVSRDRLEACARRKQASTGTMSLAEILVEGGHLDVEGAKSAAEEARALEESLAPDLPEQSRLGEFRLVREIGRGGMGIVYEAEQEPLGRRVALKVLPAGAALDERLSIRFLKEARAAARLDHPGIVSVFTSGRAAGVLYFAMELIEGRSLAEVVSTGPLAPEPAARIAADVARALDHAHRAGLVHRDVKPENVLLGPDGKARITDFGLVHEASAASFTLSHHVLGTPAFIAPEQAIGEPVDLRSDVYGLGAVLYNLLTGRAPYAGELPSVVLGRVLTSGPEPILSVNPGLPTSLAGICEKAMARRREDRYPTALAMAEDLEAYLEGRPVSAPPASVTSALEATPTAGEADAVRSTDTPAPGRATASGPGGHRRRSGDRPVLDEPLPAGAEDLADPGTGISARRFRVFAAIATIATVGLVLLLLAIPAVRARRAGGTTPGPAPASDPLASPFTRIGTFVGRRDAPRLSPDGRFVVYASREHGHWDIILRELSTGDGTQAAKPQVVDLTSDSSVDETTPVFSPDGKSIAYSTGARGGRLSIESMDLDTHRRRTMTEFGEEPDWSPDGRTIVLISGTHGPEGHGVLSRLYQVDVAGGKSRLLNGIDAAGPTYSPSGSRIAFTSQSGGQTDIWTIAAAGGEATRLTNDAAVDFSPVWTADGGTVVFGSDREGSFGLWRIGIDESSGRPKGEPKRLTGAALAAPFLLSRSARDGRIVLAINYGVARLHRLRFDPDAGAVQGPPVAFPRRFMAAGSPDVTADGRLLVFAAEAPQEDLAVQAADGASEPVLITQDAAHDRSPRWSRDGSRVAFESDRDGAAAIWTARSDGTDARKLIAMPGPEEEHQPVWSPDGKRIAVGNVIVDVESGAGGAPPRAETLPAFGDGSAARGEGDGARGGGSEARSQGSEVHPQTSGAGAGATWEAWAWSPNGATLAGTAGAGGIVVYDVRARSYRRLTDSGERPVWTPDGRSLLFTNDRVLYMMDASGDAPARAVFSAAPGDIEPGVAIAPDGRTLYVSLVANPDEVWTFTPPER